MNVQECDTVEFVSDECSRKEDGFKGKVIIESNKCDIYLPSHIFNLTLAKEEVQKKEIKLAD